MKKVVLSLLCVLTLITFVGCGKKENVSLNLDKISKDLEELTTDEIYIQGIDIESMGVFSELEYVYEFDFEDILGLDPELVSEYSVNYNYKEKEILAIFRPVDGKTNEVKESLEGFMDEIDAELQEFNGLLVYVASSDNELVFKTVKETKMPIFGMMEQITDETLSTLNINVSDVEEYLIKQSPVGSVVRYIIIKPAEGKEEVIKNTIEKEIENLEKTYEFYGVGQYELVKNRRVEKIGDYLIYLITPNNDLVFNTISNNKIVK